MRIKFYFLIICFLTQIHAKDLCFLIKEITLSPLEDAKEDQESLKKYFGFAKKITKNYENQCLDQKSINELLQNSMKVR